MIHRLHAKCLISGFLLLLFYHSNAFAQVLHAPPEYSQYTAAADSLLNSGRHEQAITYYQRAFHAFGGRFTQDDRYNYARAFSLSGNADSTIQTLKKLCVPGQYWDYPTLLKDPAFNNVKSHPGFAEAIACMKANKQKYAPNFNYRWRDMLDSLHQRDQAIRRELSAAHKSNADSLTIISIIHRMQAVDSLNVSIIDNLLDKNGLPGYDVVGLRGVSTIILTLLHSPLKIQLKYLPLVRKGVKKKNIQPYELAMLEDKVSVAQNGSQIYGSQLSYDESGKPILVPIKDEANVNKRRAAVGLEPLEQYLKLFGITYIPKQPAGQ